MPAAFDQERIAELFSAFGSVRVRRMFGGAGLFADGLMFGLVHDDVIYLKADKAFAPMFEQEGSTHFTYRRLGNLTALGFWRLPERLYDDPNELAGWAKLALGCARTASAEKRPA